MVLQIHHPYFSMESNTFQKYSKSQLQNIRRITIVIIVVNVMVSGFVLLQHIYEYCVYITIVYLLKYLEHRTLFKYTVCVEIKAPDDGV